MQPTQHDLLEIILRDCANARPKPWYPGEYSRATGVDRSALDGCLDRLRLAGLVALTEWVRDQGQGYRITPHGEAVLQSPRLLSQVRQGTVPQAQPEADAPEKSNEQHALRPVRGEKVRASLLDDSRPIITQLLIAANVLWFLVGAWVYQTQHGGSFVQYFTAPADQKFIQTMFETGALSLVEVIQRGEWWRLLSHGFVHTGGILHIVMNMMFLYSVGPMLERMWGKACYVAIYLTALAGGGAVALLFQDPAICLGGASGALCGLLGAMLSWVLVHRNHLPPALVSSWQGALVRQIMLIAFISLLPNVSWAAHLGGFIAGLVAAIPLSFARFGVGPQRYLGWVGLAAIIAASAAFFVPEVNVIAARDGIVRRGATAGPAGLAEIEAAGKDESIRIFQGDELAGRAREIENKLLTAKARSLDKQFLDRARDQLGGIRKKLETVDARLQPDKYREPTLVRFLNSAKTYLHTSAELCALFVQSLENADTWPPEDTTALRDGFRRAKKEKDVYIDSYRSLEVLKEQSVHAPE